MVNEEAIFSPSGASAGVGFAVPLDTVNRVVPQLIARGKYIRPGLGIAVDEGFNRKHGTPGDSIVAIDGPPVESVARLLAKQDDHQVGDGVRLPILRESCKAEVTVTLVGGA